LWHVILFLAFDFLSLSLPFARLRLCALQCNLVVQFSSDALDQSPRLATLLKRRFGAFGAPDVSPAASAAASSGESVGDGRAGPGRGAAGMPSRGAPRSFVRLPGNHGTPNDWNPGDTWPSRRGSRSSRAVGEQRDDDATVVTVELGRLADCAADYLTDRALWRRPADAP
jgi:hypothetical protein